MQIGKGKTMQKFLLLVMLIFSGCARMAGYGSDYYVYNHSEIKEILKNKTVIDGSETIYFAKDSKCFMLRDLKNGKGVVSKCKWYIDDDTMTINGKSYEMDSVCIVDENSKKTCHTLFKNNQKYYFDTFAGSSLTLSNGPQVLIDSIVAVKYPDLSILDSLESVVQENKSIDKKRKIVKKHIAEEKRKERERLARIKREREKEERARQARLAQQRQNSYSTHSNRYITSMGYDAASYDYDKYTVWYRQNISISDGSHIWAKVDRMSGCYSLLVGSTDSSIYGNCSNCSNSINGYWSCHANGAGSFSVQGNQVQATNGIVQRSR
jgi:hypothetical protein